MNERGRLLVLLLAFALLASGVWHIIAAMPRFGTPEAAYGPAVAALLPSLRHVSNMVAAVNFDVRSVDTLGEESMLFAAITGTVVLLRGSRGEEATQRAGHVPGRARIERDDATALVCRVGGAFTILFGSYVILHGTVTPGGGFQGGAITASGLLLVYIGQGYQAWRRLVQSRVLPVVEAAGVLIFVAAGLVPLGWRLPAFANTLPYGQWKDLYSGGLMVIINLGVGFAVLGGFGLMLAEFLEETRSLENDPVPDEETP